jgi:hypothetical protein
MKIVIDIDENVYTRLFDNGIQDNEIAVDDVCEMARALRLGAPLPKGHGNLIDADKLYSDYVREPEEFKGGRSLMNLFREAPTIIEADKEK